MPMFTRCPACRTQFRVRAQHLRAADGWVRCGACGEAFDGVRHLLDEPGPGTESSAPATIAQEPRSTGAPLRSFDSALEDLELPRGLRSREAAQEAEPGETRSPDPFAIDDRLPAVDDEDEDEESASRRRNRIWTILFSLLLLVMVIQVAWFQRDQVANQFAFARPLFEGLCEQLDCEVYRRHPSGGYELLSRDVRTHPVYKDVLLVNATFANSADRRQPYPNIQLALYDPDGDVLGYREFAPADYLDESLSVAAGMPPQKPLHVVLEVSGPTEGAVSFEFGFL